MYIDFISITRSTVKIIISHHTKLKVLCSVFIIIIIELQGVAMKKLAYFRAIVWEATNKITLTLYIFVFPQESQQSSQIKRIH